LLIALNEIFRPTWRKVVWTLTLGGPLSLLGFLFAWIPHKPDYVETFVAVLLLPLWLLDFLPWLGSLHKHWSVFLIFSVIQFAYYYILSCSALRLFYSISASHTLRKEGQGK
jgi:hypothetical protein